MSLIGRSHKHCSVSTACLLGTTSFGCCTNGDIAKRCCYFLSNSVLRVQSPEVLSSVSTACLLGNLKSLRDFLAPHLLRKYGTVLDSSMVEHSAVNRRVAGSSPARGVIWLRGQAVKTSPFHGGNTGSIPVGVTICRNRIAITTQRHPRSGCCNVL